MKFASGFSELILLLLCLTWTVEAVHNKTLNVSGFYVFGDSTVDPGNNNYVATILKSNFPPYGKDFKGHIPTGRFSNGRLTTDFIASYAGLKELVPPYLDPKLRIAELMTGVSFASAGSGFDPLTPAISGVVPLEKQLEYFRECKTKLETVLGKEMVAGHMKNSAFLISAGTNDFTLNYFTLPIRRRRYSVLAYQQFLIQQVKDFIEALAAEGARKIAVVGLPPMGCLPMMITLNSENAVLQRNCINEQSSVAMEYNLMLQHQLSLLMQLNFTIRPGATTSSAKLYYIDIYHPLASIIHGLANLGFEHFDTGCCGTGLIETSFMCNPRSSVCDDAAKYVFWDSVHPTEKAYYQIFQSVRNVVDFILNDKI